MTTAPFGGAGGKLGHLKAQTLTCIPPAPAVSSSALRAHLASRAHGQPPAHPLAGCDGELPMRQHYPPCGHAGPPLSGLIVKGGERPAHLRRKPLTRQKQGGLRWDGKTGLTMNPLEEAGGCESLAFLGQENHKEPGHAGTAVFTPSSAIRTNSSRG